MRLGRWVRLHRTLPLCALALLTSSTALALAIRVNGVCYVGNCASPDTLSDGQTIGTPFNFTVTLANGDQYYISGSVLAKRASGTIASSGYLTAAVAGSSASSTDTLAIELLQNNAAPPSSVSQSETVSLTPVFAGPYSPASTASLQATISSSALPLVGPLNPTSPAGSVTALVLFPGGVPFLVDDEFTFTFGAGSREGASISAGVGGAGSATSTTTTPAVNAGGLCNDGSGSGGGNVLVQGGSCSILVCSVANDGGGSGSNVELPQGTATGCSTFALDSSTATGTTGTLVSGPFINPSQAFNFGCGAGGVYFGVNSSGSTIGQEGSGSGGIGVDTITIAADGSGSGSNVENPYPDVIHAKAAHANAVRSNASAASTAVPVVELITPVRPSASIYTVSTTCQGLPASSCWLTVAIPSGTIAANSATAITAAVNPAGLSPGLYSGTLTVAITPTGSTASTVFSKTVQTIVTPPGAKLQLSHAGMNLQATQGASNPPAQTLYIANTEQGTTAMATVATSGESWLTVSQPSGPVAAGTPVPVTVSVSPSGLAPGLHSSRIDINGSGVVNGTQSAVVSLNVLAPSTSTGLAVSTTALVFTAPFGSSAAAQTLQLFNGSNQTLTPSTSAAYMDGEGWLGVTAGNLKETVAVNMAGYPVGAYMALLTVHTAETNTNVPVQVISIVTPASGCTPSILHTLFANLEGGFTRTAGGPVPLDVLVVDGCGSPVSLGTATAYFPATLDSPVSLLSVGNGHWLGSWQPQSLAGAAAQVAVLAMSAGGTSGTLVGSSGVSGTLAPNPSVPVVSAGGVSNAASGLPLAVAPGEFISIYGSNLAQSASPAQTPPYPGSIAATQVVMNGQSLPLQFAGQGQINAIVPFNTPQNGIQPMLVESNGVYSQPVLVAVGAASPGVFTQSQTGQGAGAVLTVSAKTGAVTLNTASAPAHAGDVLEVYCTGLGTVSPAVPSGTAAPLQPFSYSNNMVTAAVGGVAAQVQFAGLAPGFAGLYQVNVTVPAGVTGSSVPLVLTEAGINSATVTVAVQ